MLSTGAADSVAIARMPDLLIDSAATDSVVVGSTAIAAAATATCPPTMTVDTSTLHDSNRRCHRRVDCRSGCIYSLLRRLSSTLDAIAARLKGALAGKPAEIY
ncbi:hypothetical protein [Leptolyngbya sp. O-77]|uniref:hypothetical protein n=1 Tax=Leptolyngbya sp. O-77 TaxID=1080068 RepID=UPI0012E3ECD7|nr:hypothetical protein [Leptolyngbya sp. O-77]